MTDGLYSEDDVMKLANAVVTHGTHAANCPCVDNDDAKCDCGYGEALEIAFRISMGQAGPMTGWSCEAMDVLPDTGDLP